MSQVCPNTKQLCTSFRCEGGCYWGENAGKSAEQQGTPTPRTEEVESLIAILGDGAAKLRDDKYSDELAQAMDDAVEALSELSRLREDCEKLWDAAAFLRDLKTMKEALETQRGPVLTLAGGQVDRSVIQKYYDDNKERAWGNLRAALSTTRKEEGNG